MPPQAARSNAMSPDCPDEPHAGYLAVRQDHEFNCDLALFQHRRTRLFGNQVVPVHPHDGHYSVNVWAKIDAHGVAEHVEAASDLASTAVRKAVIASAARRVASPRAVLGRLLNAVYRPTEPQS